MTINFIIIGSIVLFLCIYFMPYKKEKKESYLGVSEEDEAFLRVCHTLRGTNVVVSKEKDGIYVRLADGDEGAFTLEFAKVYSFDKNIRENSNYKKNKK